MAGATRDSTATMTGSKGIDPRHLKSPMEATDHLELPHQSTVWNMAMFFQPDSGLASLTQLGLQMHRFLSPKKKSRTSS